MILRQVGDVLKDLEAATVGQLAAELSVSRAEVESALDFWIHRGDVRRCESVAGPACGTTCTRCPIGKLPRKKSAGPIAGDSAARGDTASRPAAGGRRTAAGRSAAGGRRGAARPTVGDGRRAAGPRPAPPSSRGGIRGSTEPVVYEWVSG